MRDNLVVVHDKMLGQELAGAFYQLIEEPSESDEIQIDRLTESQRIDSAIEAFENTLEKLRNANRIKRVAKVTEPVLSCVYIRPVL